MIEASSLKKGELYVHDESQGIYVFSSIGKMKVAGFWVEAAVYQGLDGQSYTRSLPDFLEKFSPEGT